MIRAFSRISLAALVCAAVFAQTTDSPAFTVADVHVSPHSTNAAVFMTGGVLRGGRYDLRKATMVDLIRMAWDIDADRVLGGPNWLELDRFDVVAKAPPATPPETVRLMLQALLAERFQLKVHGDTKPMPGFVLSLGKGKPKIKEADGSGVTGCQPVQQKTEPGAVPYAVVSCRNVTMEAFARQLRTMAGNYVTTTVLDSTGLKGTWDFDLKWTARGMLARAGADGVTIFDGIDKELGLKLEGEKVPAPVIIVDSVNEKPSDNPPGVTTSLPPPPPGEFEVADIKQSAPGTNPFGRILPGGRLEVRGVTLKMLIQDAWNINGDETILGLPKFADSNRFDIIAKASVGANGTANAPQADWDDLRLMLQALLKDRFKLATHMEERPIPAYSLVAVKPKLTKADPLNRARCKEGPAATGKDPRDAHPILSRMLTCQSMTMAQFAEQLPSLASGYIHTPVLDETGIEGSWDFTLNFSAAGLLNGPAGGRGGDAAQSGGAVPAASDPSGALSLFDAVSKQLGLKLELRKRPVPMLVIDHIEENPTDN